MRTDPGFDPDRYSEDPQDGRSHIRSQVLSDFYSLLHHDVAGQGEPSSETWEFVKGRKYQKLSARELEELDRLASVMSEAPGVEQLLELYLRSPTLRLEAAEQDPYCFLFSTN
jgi:hypothetical protein